MKIMQFYIGGNKTENVREWCEVISLIAVPNFNVKCSTHSWFTPEFLFCTNSFISFVCRMRFTTEVKVEARELCNSEEGDSQCHLEFFFGVMFLFNGVMTLQTLTVQLLSFCFMCGKPKEPISP